MLEFQRLRFRSVEECVSELAIHALGAFRIKFLVIMPRIAASRTEWESN
jgi:hypothetical protein